MTSAAPVALFVYKRLDHLKQTINSLQKNHLSEKTNLIIYSDAARSEVDIAKVYAVRTYLKQITGFAKIEIIESAINKGLAESIITGVSSVIEKYGKVIVLEDDMVLSPWFLQFMNDGLDYYENEERVVSIHGYCYPVKEKLPSTFFLRGTDCWGWATWYRGWQIFENDGEKLLNELKSSKLCYELDFNGNANKVRMLKNQITGKVDSWAIRWHASAFLQNKLTLYPGTSLVQNIGADGEGTHTRKTDSFEGKLANEKIEIKPIEIGESNQAREAFAHFYRSMNKFPLLNFVKKIRYLF